MASMLRNAAVKSVNKGQPSAFYPDDKNNPVFMALEQEIKSFVNIMKKRASSPTASKESLSRFADLLFDLWNKYEEKLPKKVFNSKLLEVGHFLFEIKEYNLALWQCYERYIKSFGDVNLDETFDVKSFKKTFFPNGFHAEDTEHTFQALIGRSACSYERIKLMDPKLQNSHSVDHSVIILKFLRLMTQVILPTEKLCWLVYNGTIRIYQISRHLMTKGHSSKVLEFLLWASMCMETSLPLLGVHYLKWRVTLYASVCQCYYDCKAGVHAEAFARRAVSKINELSQLESLSSNPESKEVEEAFRQATIKMAIMIYKRTVYETRRKPKGLLRPKTRANLKDAVQLPWPRTQSERLLSEMFEGGSAQMLCLLETITDSNRRTLLSNPPAAENEVELLDVFAELFLAAQELIAGGGGSQSQLSGSYYLPLSVNIPRFGGVCKEIPMMQLATQGEDGVPLSVVVKVVKLAYCYEQWDVFDTLLPNTLSVIKEINSPTYDSDLKALELLQAYDKVVPRAKQRCLFGNDEEEEEGLSTEAPAHDKGQRSNNGMQDDLIEFAEVLLSVINGPLTQDQFDNDMMVDATLFLWSKCKAIFQKFQTGSTDNPKYLQKMDNPGKWVYLLDIVHQALSWSGLSSIDPALTAEVVLRLSLVFEASSLLEMKGIVKSGANSPSKGPEDEETTIISTVKDAGTAQGTARELSTSQSELSTSHCGGSQQSIFSATALSQGVLEQLQQARSILESGLDNVSLARTVVALTDGKSITDVIWVKEFNTDLFAPVIPTEDEVLTDSEAEECLEAVDGTAVWNTVRDLHMELLFMYHRICLKLINLGSRGKDKGCQSKNLASSPHASQRRLGNKTPTESYEDLMKNARCNGLSKALLLMQRAMEVHMTSRGAGSQEEILREAIHILRRVEAEEKRLYLDNFKDDQSRPPSKLPPSPILLCRTEVSMTLKPATFTPITGEKVAWYRIFARNAAGSNVKVRMSDYTFPGTGEQTPSFNCEFEIRGLTPGEQYMFAVAAYTADGQLIGKGIGDSTLPILASHPMPVLMAWAFLSQLSYQVGCVEICESACRVLWAHFVAEPPPSQGITYTTSTRKDFKLTLHKLNQRVVTKTSPVLLRLFLTSIFIRVDIAVRRGQLFCTKLCDEGPLHQAQIARLKQCEIMLVAMQLAGWMNENNLALQAAVQCYGLLAPLLHYKIPCVAITQVLERCCAVLLEVPSHIRVKRTAVISEGLHHMTACLTFNMAKVMRGWGQRSLASHLNDCGRRLLAQDSSAAREAMTTEGGDAITETGSLTLAALKKRKGKKGGLVSGKEECFSTGNEELKALEAHMLRLSKQAQGEHELSGNEDPSILHAYIAYLPGRIAFKEVVKFKRRARYLEFFTQCVQKTLSEGTYDLALEWCEETTQWLIKRNENIIGTRTTIGKQPGAMTLIGDDPKKFQAALVEYSKEKPCNLLPNLDPKLVKALERDADSISASQPQNAEEARLSPASKEKLRTAGVSEKSKPRSKKPKYKAIAVTNLMSDAQRQAQEELEIRALDVLSLYFIDAINHCNRRKKLRKISADEMPWRAQLNLVKALSQFGVFMKRLEIREKMIGGHAATYLYRTSFLEEDWFSFETTGTLIVNWSGGPSRQATRQGQRSDKMSEATMHEEKASGIEIAAAAATGVLLEMTESPRTKEASKGTGSPGRQNVGKGRKKGKEEEVMVTREEGVEMLKRTFTFFKKAIILAHRGHHWMLLQNVCRALWNCAQTALSRAHSPNKNGIGTFLEVSMVRTLLWQPLYCAADCLLDMMVQLQQTRSKREPIKDAVRSWMGAAKDERGGANLKFEADLDDLSTVDVRWVRRITLRVLELLHHQQKWERLVDLSLRFNALSDDRYTEGVSPLMLQAQRKLVERVAQYDGISPPQPHFLRAEKEMQSAITPKLYTQLQLKAQLQDGSLSEVNPGAHIDPDGHNAYSGGLHALRLCCVPLDVANSLQNLRKILHQSEYTARALQHSRRLLTLYLAGQTCANCNASTPAGPSQASSRVDFMSNTACPQPSMPLDLSHTEFQSPDDIQMAPLPKGQITVVMRSYQKTIELLLAGGQRDLAAEAMRELGNLHFHTGNNRAAYKCWAEALDLILQTTDALGSWREVFKGNDIAAKLLKRCGLWGCILAGVICSNIAQYILTSDLGLRVECCFLAGYLFKALFRASLPHPTADHDYALYEIGESCEVTHLIPGIDLLSEKFRSDGRSLVAALRFIMDELHRSRHNLFMLPMVTLYLYFTTFVCRDLKRAVDGRILKIRVLTELCFFPEALVLLQRLLRGESLPNGPESSLLQSDTRFHAAKFNSQKPILEPSNLKVLDSIIDKRLSSNLGPMYGPHLTCQLTLVQASLLIAIADTIPVLPKFSDVAPPGSYSYQAQSMATASVGERKFSTRHSLVQTKPTKKESEHVTLRSYLKAKRLEEASNGTGEEESHFTRHMHRFSQGDSPPCLEGVKGSLLSSADQMLTTVSEIIIESAQIDKGLSEKEIRLCQHFGIHMTHKGIEKMNAAELELVVEAKKHMACIARQRHHSSMAARIVLSAMTVLQRASILGDSEQECSSPQKAFGARNEASLDDGTVSPVKIVDGKSVQYQFQNAQSRSRLDARTWLSLRHSLIECLKGEMKGMGEVKGSEKAVEKELADVHVYCKEGIREAEVAGDLEMQAEFQSQRALLGMLDGCQAEKTKEILQNVLALLANVRQPSIAGQLLRASTLLLLTDLEGPDISADEAFDRYCQAQEMILHQLETLGESTEHRYDNKREHLTICSPVQNLFLPQLFPLVQSKQRIGNALLRTAVASAADLSPNEAASLWSRPLGVLSTALNLSKVIYTRVGSIEADILLNMGKLQRQLFHVGKYNARSVAHTLVEAIKTSFSHDHDLSLIKQAYLEIAVLYMSSSTGVTPKTNTSNEEATKVINKDTERKTLFSAGIRDLIETPQKKKKKLKTSAGSPRQDSSEQESQAAWIATQCAAAVGEAMRARSLLSGDASVNRNPSGLGSKARSNVPDFMVLDLLGSYILGEKKRVYMNEIEEELAPLTEALEPPLAETYEDQLHKAREAVNDLSWIHVIGYQSLVQRQCGFLGNVDDSGDERSDVRCVVHSAPWSLRLCHLHRFLTQCLPAYANNCTAIYPPAALQLQPPAEEFSCSDDLIHKSYAANEGVLTDVNPEGAPSEPADDVYRPSDKHVVEPLDNTLCFLWFSPTADRPPALQEKQIMLVYSACLKPDTKPSGFTWMPLNKVAELRDQLSALMQQGEISLVESKRKEISAAVSPAPRPPSTKPNRKVARIKALSPKPVGDEKLEVILKQCMTQIQALFGQSSESNETSTEVDIPAETSDSLVSGETPEEAKPTEKIPFEMSKSNFKHLEHMFDVNFGHCIHDPNLLVWLLKILS